MKAGHLNTECLELVRAADGRREGDATCPRAIEAGVTAVNYIATSPS
jgi:hypothetical protein